MVGNTSFVKMAVQRWLQLPTSGNLLITTQLWYKCGLGGSEERPGILKEAQEPYVHVPHTSLHF